MSMAASAATPGMICSRPSVLPPAAGPVESLEQAATTLMAKSSKNDRDLMGSSRFRGESVQLVETPVGGVASLRLKGSNPSPLSRRFKGSEPLIPWDQGL